MTNRKMTFRDCFLLIAFYFVASPPFASAQYLLEALQKGGALDSNGGTLSRALYLFTTDLHKTIAEFNFSDNIFFSPLSIYVALAMLYAGSGGETKSELASALHLDVFKNESELYEGIKILLQTLDSTEKNYTLKMANRLFAQKGFTIRDDYTRKTDEYFRAQLEELDFAKDPSGSRAKINKWVETVTLNKIKDLFSKDAITGRTVLVLANAIYFKGSWLYKFDNKNTKPDAFSVSKTEKIQVPMMHLKLSKGFRYSTSEDTLSRLLELPYSDKNVSIVIVLDEGKDNFDTLLRGSAKQAADPLGSLEVRLSLPKFSIQQTMDLGKSLLALGVKQLFSNANLSGIADSSPPLVLSEAIHKAYVAVDEEGTVASAATGLKIMTKSAFSPKKNIIDFIVDRPFVFVVVEKTTGCILFFGHIKNPLKASN